jgi:hypothetical protein
MVFNPEKYTGIAAEKTEKIVSYWIEQYITELGIEKFKR